MTERKKLPAITTSGKLVVPPDGSTIVGRGLEAIENRSKRRLAAVAELDPEQLFNLAHKTHGQEIKKPIEEQNFDEVIRLASKAADQGYGRAMDLLAAIYSPYHRSDYDSVKSYMWYSLAAEYVQNTDYWWMRDELIKSRNAVAHKNWMTPEQVAKAEQLARDWKPKAPRRGSDAKPEPTISSRTDVAAKKYREAAERGDAEAQFYLGEAYHEGDGVRQSDPDAVEWWGKAAEQGHSAAQHQLGYAYREGRGVPESLILAHMWFSVSWEETVILPPRVFYSPAADELIEELEKAMTPAQVAEAQTLAREWADSHAS